MNTDRGMSLADATALADAVPQVHQAGVAVLLDADFYVVELAHATGRRTFYDEADWQAWKGRTDRG